MQEKCAETQEKSGLTYVKPPKKLPIMYLRILLWL